MDEEFNFEKKKFWKWPKFLIGAGLVGFLTLTLFFGGKISGENSLLGNFSAAVFETFGDVFGFQKEKPIYELDLATGEGRDLNVGSDVEDRDSLSGEISESGTVPTSKEFGEENKKVVGSNKNSDSRAVSRASLDSSKISQQISSEKISSTSGASVSQNPPSQNNLRDCPFSSSGNLSREIIFNETAWMGLGVSANDEWMEIKNNSLGEINLAGWQIKNQDESIKIVFGAGEKISAGGLPAGELFLLERTDDTSVPQVAADKIYVGAMSNAGEWLKLFDSNCNLVDEINATSDPSTSSGSSGWESFGGDNTTKKTLERNNSDLGWHTSEAIGGTPRAKNSEPIVQAPPSTPPLGEPPPPNPPSPEQPTSTPTSTPPSEPPPPLPPPQNQTAAKVLISEVMAGSSVAADDEFIEIYNYGSEAVDLTGWTIKKKKSSSGAESSLVVASRLEGKVIPAGKYFLLAHDGGYTGSVSPDVVWPTSYSLVYTNNSITIYNASGAVIDAVSWAEIPKDKSYSRASLDISAGFAVSDSPSPTNSQ